MSKKISLFALFFIVISYFFLETTTLFDKKITGDLIKIYDGDTITVLSGSEKLKIRFFGIDAPELKQEFGKESREHLLKICPLNSKVELFVKSIDKYKRIVAIIKCNGKILNQEQVRQGYAWAYTDYSFLYSLDHLKAKNEKLALWGSPNPIEPKVWRKSK